MNRLMVYEGAALTYPTTFKCPSHPDCGNVYVEENGNKVCVKCKYILGVVEMIDNRNGGVEISCLSEAQALAMEYKRIPQYDYSVFAKRRWVKVCIEGRNYDDAASNCVSYGGNFNEPKT